MHVKNKYSTFYLAFLIILTLFQSISNSNGLKIPSDEILITKPITQRPLPYALSVTDLTYLAFREQTIYQMLTNYTKKLEEQEKFIQLYLKDYEDSSLRLIGALPVDTDAWEKATEVALSTLTAYRMIRRFAKDFPKVQSYLEEKGENSLLHEVSNASDVYGFPMELDHNEAMEAILRLHYIYDLDIHKFSAGNILGVQTKSRLTAQQMLEIAKYALSKEYFTLAMDWLNAARFKLHTSRVPCVVSERDIEETENKILELHDQDFDAKKDKGHKYIFSEPLFQNQNLTTMRRINQKRFYGDRNPLNRVIAHYNCMALCNGENFQTEKEKANLFCSYDTTSNPYWRINPLKKEILNKDPDLIQIYDVIGEKWISYLTETAIPALKKPPDATGSRKNLRTATYAWLSDENIPEIPLSRRIELITGLNVQGEIASEYLQIAAYAFGGHVSPHIDSLPENDTTVLENGNRVTTFLIYLNSVAKSGRTVFPSLGISVTPMKGSAILWYTSLKNGSIDRRLLHAACPVFGQKWIATKWTNLNVNFLKRPCTTNHLE